MKKKKHVKLLKYGPKIAAKLIEKSTTVQKCLAKRIVAKRTLFEKLRNLFDRNRSDVFEIWCLCRLVNANSKQVKIENFETFLKFKKFELF